MFNGKTLHPLINLVDLNKSNELLRTKFTMNFYAIVIKETRCGDIRYGNKYYDYDDGSMVFFAPNQIVISEPEGEVHQPYGTALIFHTDLLKGTNLGKQIHEYSFFGYQSYEALHLSEKEKDIVTNCLENITTEISQNIDQHSKKLIVANLELLLKYCSRFYDRQFITRDHVNKGVLAKFEELLKGYFSSDKPQNIGLPSVAYFANELHLSANYFGDLIKKETGKTVKDLIHDRLIDAAKDKVFDDDKTISEIAYELGFKYPQHFSRLFKQRVGYTPNEYKHLN